MTATLIAVFDARRDGLKARLMSHEPHASVERLSRAIAYLTYRLYRRAL